MISIFRKSVGLLPVFLAVSILAGTVPLPASAQQNNDVYYGTYQVPNSRIVSDSSIVTGRNQTNNALTGLSVSTRENGGFSSSFHEKYFSSSISDAITQVCNASEYSNGVLKLLVNNYSENGSTNVPCSPLFTTPVTIQNITSANYSLGGGVTAHHDIPDALLLAEIDKTYRVESIENDLSNVRVITDSQGIAELYGLRFSRYGIINQIIDGDWINRLYGAYNNIENTSLYRDGKTYLIDWQTGWDGLTPTYGCNEYVCLGGQALAPAPQLTQIASVISPVQTEINEPRRPRNSDIVQFDQFYEQSYESGGWFSNPKAHQYYASYGLSADGRTGTAYKEEWQRAGNSGFSEIAGPLIVVGLIAFSGSDWGLSSVLFSGGLEIGTGLAVAGVESAVSFAGANALTAALNPAIAAFGVQTILQSQIINIVKVEDSNTQINAGPWTWSELPPTPSCPTGQIGLPPNCALAPLVCPPGQTPTGTPPTCVARALTCPTGTTPVGVGATNCSCSNSCGMTTVVSAGSASCDPPPESACPAGSVSCVTIIGNPNSAPNPVLNPIVNIPPGPAPIVNIPPRPAAAPAPRPAPSPPPSPVCVFFASPSTIIPPQSSSLIWRCNNASSCSIDNGIGPVRVSSSTTVSPSQTTVYTLTCNGSSFQTTLRVTGFNIKEIAP